MHQRRGCVACSAKAGRAAAEKPEERPAERPVREVPADVGRLALERRILELTSTVKIQCASQRDRFPPLGPLGPRASCPGWCWVWRREVGSGISRIPLRRVGLIQP